MQYMESQDVTISPIKTKKSGIETMSVGIDLYHVNLPLRSNSAKRNDPTASSLAMDNIMQSRVSPSRLQSRNISTSMDDDISTVSGNGISTSNSIGSLSSESGNLNLRVSKATGRQQQRSKGGKRVRTDWRRAVLDQVSLLDRERGYTTGLGALRPLNKSNNPFEMHQHLVSAIANNMGVPVKDAKGRTRPHPFFDRQLNATFNKKFVDDPTRSTCPVCTAIAADRCQYCLKAKTSDAPRLKIKDLGRRIIRVFPDIDRTKLIDMIHDYGRSAMIARGINKKLGWDGGSIGEKGSEAVGSRHLYCGKHFDAMSDLEDYAAGLERELHKMKTDVVVWLDKVKEQARDLEFAGTIAEEKAKNEKAAIRFKSGFSQMKLRKTANETTHFQQDMLEDFKNENRELRITVETLKKELEEYKCPDCENLQQDLETLSSTISNVRRDNIKLKSENEEVQMLKSHIAKLTEILEKGHENESGESREHPLVKKCSKLESEKEILEKEVEFLKHRVEQMHEQLEHTLDSNNEQVPESPTLTNNICPRCLHHMSAEEMLQVKKELQESLKSESIPEPEVEPDQQKKIPGEFSDPSDIARKFKKLTPLPKYLNKRGKFLKSRSKAQRTRVSTETILDTMFEIYEKKCLADEADIRAGNQIDSFPEFIKDYFLQSFGLAKIASKKQDEFVMGAMSLIETEPRINTFITVLGLNIKMMHVWTRNSGDFWSLILRRTFCGNLKGIKEQLDDAPDFITPLIAKQLVIGLHADIKDSTTWETPQLSKLATTEQLQKLLIKIDEVPTVETDNALNKAKLDLDAVWQIIFDQYMEWGISMQQRIINSYVVRFYYFQFSLSLELQGSLNCDRISHAF